MLLWLLSLFICIFTKVSCQECTDNTTIRLAEGRSKLEGRVEICLNGKWGTVCDDFWDQTDASVVCRQLGFLPQGAMAHERAHFGQGSGSIHLDNVQCSGGEQRLIECPSISNHNCRHYEDAGVSCQGIVIQAGVSITDVSVLVSWQSNSVAVKYDVTITQIVNSTRSGIITEVPGSVTVFVYEELLPEQNYTACVTGYFSQQRVISSCREFQIVLSTQSHPTYSPSSSQELQTISTTQSGPTFLPSSRQELQTPSSTMQSRSTFSLSSTLVSVTRTITAASNDSTLVWILGSIIAVLVFLLIVAGVGLAYPRCIRHRVKDKKYLSKNEAYIERSQQLTANQGTTQSANEIYVPSAYETISDPPTAQPTPGEPRQGPSTSQVTADIVAQPYEMFESRPLENPTPEAAYEMLEQVVTGGGENDHQLDDEYSRLQY